MTAVWLCFRSELRARWRSWLAMAVLVATSAGIVLAVAAGARRADSAMDRFVAATNAHDVLVFGQPFDVDLAAVAGLPEVADSARVGYALLLEPERGEDLGLTPLVSIDGGFFGRIDRPNVLEGRRPDPDRADEVAITPPLARSRNLGVGSTMTVKGFSPDQVAEIFGGGFQGAAAGPEVTFQVVGIEAIAAEGELVDSDGSEVNLHLTPAFARTYGDTIGMTPLLAIRLVRGSADLAGFRAGAERIGGGQPVQMNSQAEEGSKPRRSIRLQAVALSLFAGLAALAAVLALGQAFARQAFTSADDHPALRALGMTGGQLWTAAMLRAAAIGVVGATVAVTVAVMASPLMPLGLARLTDPSPGVSVDTLVLGLGLLAVPVLVLAVTALPAWRAARGASKRGDDVVTRRTSAAERLGAAGMPPSAVAGVRLAINPGHGPTAAPVRSAIIGIAMSLAATTTVVMFGAGLDHLFSTPRLYGWNWDFTVGNPYVSDIAEQTIPVLRRSPGVAAFSAVAVTDLDIGGARTQALGVEDVTGSVGPPIIDGRAPRQPDEVALGANTLDAVDRSLGQTMDIRAGDAVSTVRIVGTAVFASIGQFDVKRPGEGALFTVDGLRRLVPGAPRNVFPVQVAGGADLDKTVAALDGDLDEVGLPAAPVEVANFGQVDRMPEVLTGLLALMAATIMAHALATTVRRRRRDLAILKTLGFVRGQVRATVAWQATTMTGLALLAGIPIGIVAGRFGWHLFARELGVVPVPVVPVVAMLVAVPVALLLGNLVAAVPGSAAARARPAEGLRAE